jgi:hypothetical protein
LLIGPLRGPIGSHANPRCQLSQNVVDREGVTRDKNKCERCGWSVSIGKNRDPIKMHAVSIITHKWPHYWTNRDEIWRCQYTCQKVMDELWHATIGCSRKCVEHWLGNAMDESCMTSRMMSCSRVLGEEPCSPFSIIEDWRDNVLKLLEFIQQQLLYLIMIII